MKQFFYIYILMLICNSGIAQIEAANGDRCTFYSIIATVDTINGTQNQIDYIYSIINDNLTEPFSVGLLEDALERATVSGDSVQQLRALFTIGRCYFNQKNISMHLKNFQYLRQKSFEYHMYKYYFTTWYSILQLAMTNSDIVYVSEEVKKMRVEADILMNNEGYVYSSLIQASLYRYNGKRDDAIAVYQELINSSRIGYLERFRTYHRLIRMYTDMKEYDKAIHNTLISEELLNKKLEEKPIYKAQFNNRYLDVELSYCRIYVKMKDQENLKLHLDKASQYISKNTFFSQTMLYLLWSILVL